MDEMESKVRDEFDEVRDEMDEGFSGMLGKVEEWDADHLRREVQILMMVGHEQMTTIRLLRNDLDGMARELLKKVTERQALVKDVGELAEVAGIPFDPDCDSLHTTLRHVISVVRPGDGRAANRRRVMETVLTVAGSLAAVMLFVLVMVVVAACVR